MVRPSTVRLLATLAATGASASPASSVAAAQAVTEPEGRSLSAAVEEARGSPFHARAAPLTEALGLHAPPGDPIAAVGHTAALAGAPADDTSAAPAKLSKVFLASWGAAAVSHWVAYERLPYWVYGQTSPRTNVGIIATPILLPVAGAVLAGAPAVAAIGGSLLGLAAGIGVWPLFDTASSEPGMPALAASSLAHAGVITLFTWWAERGYR